MAQKKDLTGRRFGRLVVLEETASHIQPNGKKIRVWLCRCDCGKQVKVIGQSLINGSTSSCGCLHREIAKETLKPYWGKNSKNLVGLQFGRLKVIKRVGSSPNGSMRYLCRCACGQDIEVDSKHLLDGNTRSCGCLSKENARNQAKINDIGHYSSFDGTKICCLTTTLFKNNTTGIRGCYWDKSKQRYVVRIKAQGHTYRIGAYKTIAEAKEARAKAEEKYWNPLKDKYYERNNYGRRKETGGHKDIRGAAGLCAEGAESAKEQV